MSYRVLGTKGAIHFHTIYIERRTLCSAAGATCRAIKIFIKKKAAGKGARGIWLGENPI
jgi:hypothetical protein